jgi:phage baseplate assembly protein W
MSATSSGGNTARQPWRLASNRRVATGNALEHVDDLVRAVLLTDPGERLHRPGFGAGLGVATLFEPVTGDLAAAVTARTRGSLADALGDRIAVLSVTVSVADTTIAVEVVYRPLPSGAQRTVLLELPAPGGAT